MSFAVFVGQGETWEPVAEYLNGTSLTLDKKLLKGGEGLGVRVMVTDGFQTDEAASTEKPMFAIFLPLVATLLLLPPFVAPTHGAPPDDIDAPLTLNTFRDIARAQMPCVVNITIDVVEEAKQEAPLFRFYRRVPNHPEQHRQGMGSGLIIDSDGTIVTNHHVVAGADSIEVTLTDGTVFDASLLASDSLLDIALLKVAAEHPLQAGQLGDSAGIEIGDWVLAIGSPYGLSHSVSAGIVSALGRDINTGVFDSYIQTDAAINRGNSGGPLFDVQGRVIGINTAIISSSGGSNGIGFAIPINRIKDILQELREKGKIIRGWAGLTLRDLEREDLKERNLDSRQGAMVTEVWKHSPAADAGLLKSDIVISFDGKDVHNTKQLLFAISRAKIGATLSISVLREGETAPRKMTIVILERPGEIAITARSGRPESILRPEGLGITLEPISGELRKRYEIGGDSGFVITEIEKESTAADAGLKTGDLIIEVNRKRIETAAELLSALQDSKRLLLLVKRKGESLFVSLKGKL